MKPCCEVLDGFYAFYSKGSVEKMSFYERAYRLVGLFFFFVENNYIRGYLMHIIDKIESEQLREVDDFRVGDSLKVHNRVKEGDKERIQIFAGICIAKQGSGLNTSFTVRKISSGEGVERVYPLHTPRIAKIEVTRRGKVRRAKLHYLRDRIGKRALYVKPASSEKKA